MTHKIYDKSVFFRQSGATLVVSLILLFVIGIGAMNLVSSIKIDSQMNRNFEERDLVFHAAERALRIVENDYIEGVSYIENDYAASCTGSQCFTADCQNSLCKTVEYDTAGGHNCATQSTKIWKDDNAWANANTLTINIPRMEDAETAVNVPVAVKYLIEFRCYIPKIANPQLEFQASEWLQYYRVTVQAVGPSTTSKVTLQANYQKG